MALTPVDDLAAALASAHPELDAVRETSSDPLYLVGGAVRDLLLRRARSDVDLVVVGDAVALAERFGGDPVLHDRFATATATVEGHEVDFATARSESYAAPGALPDVEPAGEIEVDLGRRDFTINSMAISLRDDPELIDPHGGRRDLDEGVLRILHPGSFADDPTRALRAARYAARLDFEPEPRTAALLREADLATVSADRRDAELLRVAAEPHAARGFELLAEWGLVEPRPGGVELAARVARLLSTSPWGEVAERDSAIFAAALGPARAEAELAAARPGRPSEAVELARRHDPVELALARALGAEWLDLYLSEWRQVRLEIGGGDLIAAGVPEGPAVGRGLALALRLKLDGEIGGREEELASALEAAGGSR